MESKWRSDVRVHGWDNYLPPGSHVIPGTDRWDKVIGPVGSNYKPYSGVGLMAKRTDVFSQWVLQWMVNGEEFRCLLSSSSGDYPGLAANISTRPPTHPHFPYGFAVEPDH